VRVALTGTAGLESSRNRNVGGVAASVTPVYVNWFKIMVAAIL
jgi:hypothetical protein